MCGHKPLIHHQNFQAQRIGDGNQQRQFLKPMYMSGMAHYIYSKGGVQLALGLQAQFLGFYGEMGQRFTENLQDK